MAVHVPHRVHLVQAVADVLRKVQNEAHHQAIQAHANNVSFYCYT